MLSAIVQLAMIIGVEPVSIHLDATAESGRVVGDGGVGQPERAADYEYATLPVDSHVLPVMVQPFSVAEPPEA